MRTGVGPLGPENRQDDGDLGIRGYGFTPAWKPQIGHIDHR